MASSTTGRRVVTSVLGRLSSEADGLISSGVERFNAGDLPAALQALDRAVEKDPRSPGARLFRALAFLRLGRRAGFRRDLDRALSLTPRPAERRAMRAQVCAIALGEARRLEAAGQGRAALAACADALAADPSGWEAWEAQASMASRLGRVKLARRSLEGLLRLRGFPVERRLAAARLLSNADRFEEALAQCRAALRAEARSVLAWRLKCELQAASGLKAEALDSLRRAGRAAAPTAASELWAAAICVSLGEYGPAAARAAKAAELEPASAAAWSRLAELRLLHGEAKEAERCAARALELDPKAALAWRALGGAAVLAGRAAQAEAPLRRALELSPADGEARAWLAEAFRGQGRFPEAAAEAERALAGGSRPLGALINRALARLAGGQAVTAAEYDEIFMRVPWKRLGLDLAPWPSAGTLERLLASLLGSRGAPETFAAAGGIRREPRFDSLRLQAFLRFGRVDRVLREFDRLIERDPAESYLHASRGEACLWAGRYREAERDIRRSLELFPRAPWPNVGLCAVAALKGDHAGALRLLDAAAANNASEQVMLVWRGEILRAQGDPKGALKAFAAAEVPFPFRPSLWINKALALGESGNAHAERRLFLRLCRHMEGFLEGAAREAGVRWKAGGAGLSSRSLRRTLAAALAAMLGNRSSWLYTRRAAGGRLEHIKLSGVSAGRVPPALAHNPWMFDDAAY